MNNNTKILLHLSLISGIGPSALGRICNGLSSSSDINYSQLTELQNISFVSLYSYSTSMMQQQFGFSPALADTLVSGLRDKGILDEECALLEKHNISLVTILDDDYPALLRTIFAPPMVLYVKGILPASDKKTIAFVGSRDVDAYGQRVVEQFVPPLVEQGWYIVSGGAVGVDALSHQAALKANGLTIAVLGSGLLQPYPRENKKLFDAIVEQEGALISAFPLLAPPMKQNFPARNRIISGLSLGTVIVRAAVRSGALITAQFANEQGRQVFAVPGDIFNELSQGCLSLIKQGAKAVVQSQDILEEFGIYCEPDYAKASIFAQATMDRSSGRPEFLIAHPEELQSSVSKEAKALLGRPARKTGEFSDPVVQALAAPLSFDELLNQTGLSFDALHDRLFELQVSGKIKQNFTGFWEKS